MICQRCGLEIRDYSVHADAMECIKALAARRRLALSKLAAERKEKYAALRQADRLRREVLEMREQMDKLRAA